MGVAQKCFNFLLGAVLMSLGWSLRGQFGHLKGALIPGAMAAVTLVFFHREELWRKAFGGAVILSALGFSLGGHLSYGDLIEKAVANPNLQSAVFDFARIFLIGTVWGGLGMSFLGFGLSEKAFTPSDLIFLAVLGLFWVVPLGIFNQEAYDLILFGGGLVAMHAYNFFVKKSQMMFIFGVSGILGFGLGFLFATLALYAGSKGFLGGGWPWWNLRDQIIGICGGVSVIRAFHRSVRLGLLPAREVVTLTAQKAGLIFYAVLIPFLNTLGVLIHWFFEQSMSSAPMLNLLVLFLPALFGILFVFLARIDSQFLIERGLDHVLFFSSLFFIWFLSALAIAKQIIPFGLARWEPAFTLFLVYSLILTVSLPFKVYRRILPP